jgi:RND family efflux transporter MFP subunit
MDSPTRTEAVSPPTRWRQGVAPFTAVVTVVILTSLLYAREFLYAETTTDNPLTVAAVDFIGQHEYTRTQSFLGLVVAGRRTNLGFETQGMIAEGPLRPGTRVAAGETIAALDTSALEARRRATAADLEQARVEFELAQRKAGRQAQLLSSGAVSEDVYDETRLRALALSSRVESMDARLASIDIELAKARLVAPYDGVVADRHVQHGSVVSPGTPVVRLLEVGGQESHIGVSAERAKTLKPGEAYVLKVRDRTFRAELLSIRPDIDPVTRTTTTVFALPDDLEALDGEPVTLELEETIHESGGWLPIEALLEGSRGVWTVLRLEPAEDTHRTVREAVEVLETRGDKVFVRGTLSSGSRVVASGVHRITPGTRVSVQGEH